MARNAPEIEKFPAADATPAADTIETGAKSSRGLDCERNVAEFEASGVKAELEVYIDCA